MFPEDEKTVPCSMQPGHPSTCCISARDIPETRLRTKQVGKEKKRARCVLARPAPKPLAIHMTDEYSLTIPLRIRPYRWEAKS